MKRYTVATAINTAGQIAGYSSNGSNIHAVLWSPSGGVYGAPIDLGLFAGSPSGGASAASGINDSGLIVGNSYTATDYHAALWRPSGTVYGGPTDLGTLGGARSQATAINGAGQIAGVSGTMCSTCSDAALWTPTGGSYGAPVDLGTLGGASSVATAISSGGEVTGHGLISGSSGPDPAALWTQSGGVYGAPVSLGTLGGTSATATGINDSEQIVGYSLLSGDNAQHAFVISPKSSTSSSLHPSRNPSKAGQLVTFTASVSPAAATGTVQFMDGTATLGPPQTLSSGGATYSTATLAAGAHSITAVYSGDNSFLPSTSPAVVQKVRVSSATALMSSLNPSAAGQAVTFTATVSASAATGQVTFRDGANVLRKAAVTSGSAVFTTSSLSTGTHNITASYSGDNTFMPSKSAGLVQQVS